MSQKNETVTLVLALLVTVGLLGAGFWWFNRNANVDLGSLTGGETNSPPQAVSTSQTFAEVSDVPSGSFNYGGSTSWAPIRLAVDSVLQAARPEFRLRYVDPTSGVPSSTKGIEMLIEGKLAFAQSSRPLQDSEVNRAQQSGFSLQQIPVAIDGLAVAVNPSLDISGLTLDQLNNIYTGNITNWQQVGGPNLPITPYSRPADSGGTVELFIEEVLGGQPFGATVRSVATTTEALRELSNDPGGIYFASAPEVVPQCTIKPLAIGRTANQLVPPYQEPLILPSQCPQQRNQLNTDVFRSGEYPLTRNLFVIVKQNAEIEEQAGTAYSNLLLSEQGQELIAKAGFVRIQ